MGIEGPPKIKKEVEIKQEKVEKKEEWLFDPKVGEFSFEDTVRAEKRLDNLGKVMENADFDWWLEKNK